MAGSSPRARGRRRSWARTRRRERFIPACAGKASTLTTARSSRPVHPRVRGEGEGSYRLAANGAGSSPRARGRLIAGQRVRATRRFIPACAGKARSPRRTTRSGSVHPRVRGEGSNNPQLRLFKAGSSPRARGRLRRPYRPPHRGRFIPACAGKAQAINATSGINTVHPRVRGEGKSWSQRRLRWHGSSPRARGRRFHLTIF